MGPPFEPLRDTCGQSGLLCADGRLRVLGHGPVATRNTYIVCLPTTGSPIPLTHGSEVLNLDPQDLRSMGRDSRRSQVGDQSERVWRPCGR